MKFSLVNNTTYADTDVYWAIIGQNSDGDFTHVQSDGTMTPISTSDNTNMINGQGYANYFNPLSSVPSIELNDLCVSGRVYIALGSWLPIQVQSATGYAPPSPTNPSVPGYYTIFDIFEFTYEPDATPQIHCNTSSVDFMGIPIVAELLSSDAPLSQKVGYSASRTTLLNAFQSCADSNFANLIIPGQNTGDPALRILSPEHAMNTVLPQSTVNYFNSFFDDYINATWKYYQTNTLTIQIQSSMYNGPVTGQVDSAGQNFVFYEGNSASGTQVLSLPKPTTMEVLNCNGVFNTGNELQMDIEKFIAAAMNRTVAQNTPGSNNWCGNSASYYTNTPVEYYPAILHENSIDGLCYAFAYDDVCNQSPSLVSNGTAKEVILNLTAW